MPSDHIIFAGVELSSGRKPVIFAALDGDLNVAHLEQWDVSEVLSCLKDYDNIWLAINLPSFKRGQELYPDFKSKIIQAGLKSYSIKSNTKQWLETDAQDCFRVLIGQKPLSRRTLEGRLQRALILYEQGLQINDPMEIFEEITRYKLIQGILPLENIHSSKELDALVAAYLAWMAVNRPAQIVPRGEFVLPAQE
jgi:hypothetical protein